MSNDSPGKDFLKASMGAPDNLRSFAYYTQLESIDKADRERRAADRAAWSNWTPGGGGSSSSSGSASGGGLLLVGLLGFLAWSIVTSDDFQSGLRTAVRFLVYYVPWCLAYLGASYLLLQTYLARRTHNMSSFKMGTGPRIAVASLVLLAGAIFFGRSNLFVVLFWLAPAAAAVWFISRSDTMAIETQEQIERHYTVDLHAVSRNCLITALWESVALSVVLVIVPAQIWLRDTQYTHLGYAATFWFAAFWILLFIGAGKVATDMVDEAKTAAGIIPPKSARAFMGPRKRSRQQLARKYGRPNLNKALKIYADTKAACPHVITDSVSPEAFCTWVLEIAARARRATYFSFNRRSISETLSLTGEVFPRDLARNPALLFVDVLTLTYHDLKSVVVRL